MTNEQLAESGEMRLMRVTMEVFTVVKLPHWEHVRLCTEGDGGEYRCFDGSGCEIFSPTFLDIRIKNPALLGKIKEGDKFHVDLTPANRLIAPTGGPAPADHPEILTGSNSDRPAPQGTKAFFRPPPAGANLPNPPAVPGAS